MTLRLTTTDFRVYSPIGYDPAKQYPVILYLHGRGPRGNDNEKQIGGAHLGSVIQLFDLKHPERYRSFIAVFPQTQSSWIGEPGEHAVRALDQTVKEFNGDPHRIYLAGASLGVIQRLQPLETQKSAMPAEMFALYSAQDPYAAFAKAVGSTPFWLFHGAQDDTVDVEESRKLVAALKAAGGSVRYTEYADEKHFIADRVFTDTEFLKWLMAQKLAR